MICVVQFKYSIDTFRKTSLHPQNLSNAATADACQQNQEVTANYRLFYTCNWAFLKSQSTLLKMLLGRKHFPLILKKNCKYCMMCHMTVHYKAVWVGQFQFTNCSSFISLFYLQKILIIYCVWNCPSHTEMLKTSCLWSHKSGAQLCIAPFPISSEAIR